MYSSEPHTGSIACQAPNICPSDTGYLGSFTETGSRPPGLGWKRISGHSWLVLTQDLVLLRERKPLQLGQSKDSSHSLESRRNMRISQATLFLRPRSSSSKYSRAAGHDESTTSPDPCVNWDPVEVDNGSHVSSNIGNTAVQLAVQRSSGEEYPRGSTSSTSYYIGLMKCPCTSFIHLHLSSALLLACPISLLLPGWTANPGPDRSAPGSMLQFYPDQTG